MARVFSISDLHVDYKLNLLWVSNLSDFDYNKDYLICAGDISHKIKLLSITLKLLSEKFKKVLFVPGNHDLWVRENNFSNSLEKFYKLKDLCGSFNISQVSIEIVEGQFSILICPMFAWYTKPEEGDDSLYIPKKLEDPDLKMWVDNREIKWPDFGDFSHATDYFLNLNDVNNTYDYTTIITFSHFLPRNDLIFDYTKPSGFKDPYPQFNFTRVAGSWNIDKQLRDLKSNVHIYGHQHWNRFRYIDNVLYVSHVLGSPKDRQRSGIEDKNYLLKLIWSTENGLYDGTEN